MNHWYPPDLQLREIPGEWRAENAWPPQGSSTLTFFLGADHALLAKPDALPRHELAYHPALRWNPGGRISGGAMSMATSARLTPTAWSTTQRRWMRSFRFSAVRALLQASATAPLADWFVAYLGCSRQMGRQRW